MRIALECGALGRGAVEPNPMVGAVIVRDGVELARGWHETFGGAHAERRALAAAEAAGADVRGATMYVTLEPCCHQGKTPPCTEAIIEAGIGKVVAAMTDPDEKVAGAGMQALRSAGVGVAVGVCEAEARTLLAAYVKLRTRGRPWVICKWAQTADGYIALPPGAGRWISGAESRRYVHELRGRCDGVLVGVGTVLADDPLLTSRGGAGLRPPRQVRRRQARSSRRQPARVVVDSKLRMPPDCQLARTADVSPVIVAAARGPDVARAAKLRDAGVEVLEVPACDDGVDLAALLDELGRREWTYLLAEGGAAVLAGLINARLADELLVFVSSAKAAEPREGLPRFDIHSLCRQLELGEPKEQRFGEDTMLRFVPGG